MLAPRVVAPLQSLPNLGGRLLRILSIWMGARPRPVSAAAEFMACLPDAASHTSWAVRGIQAPSRGSGAPDMREPVQ
ncbi:MAG: hypothetical protein FD187_17 [bacterium]|nr:MAG: hypothetical protein FD142_1234 [bacterium]KAF0150585.1 MAG: hypothetical protein FD187_17 [bacterium]KAF0169438.1 MAG: hypothetical protein FD158_271 [bacterium]TXT19766.1 MAG: hypothetical protein FD132_1598 [bacterium]